MSTRVDDWTQARYKIEVNTYDPSSLAENYNPFILYRYDAQFNYKTVFGRETRHYNWRAIKWGKTVEELEKYIDALEGFPRYYK
jgi:hypothetical protein